MMNPQLVWASLTLATLGLGCDRPTASPVATAGAAPSAAIPEAPIAGSAPAAAPALPASAPPAAGTQASPGTRLITFNDDTPGAPSPSFEGVVGAWYVANEWGVRGLKVDGGRWRGGTPSVSIAEQAKRLYGDRYAEFLDGVKAFAFFPFAVWGGEVPAGDLRISVRFFPIAGQEDQAAGIAFGITPKGSYLGIRANALEDNLLFFRVVRGERTVTDDIGNVPTPTRVWHSLAIELRGRQLAAKVDGQKRLEITLASALVGKIGLWSKADSQVLFDDFQVEALGAAAPTPQ